MDYFYGGKRGFSFILRPNDTRSDGYWLSLDEIKSLGVQRGRLKYGDYAIITETGPAHSDEHGKVYRIDNKNQPVLVGKIGNPAPLYDLVLTEDRLDANSITFEFLNDNASRFSTGVKGYWKMTTTEEGEDVIGLSFDFPKPVISFNNIPFNNLKSGKQAGITRRAEGVTYPMEYAFDNVVPPATYVGNISERLSAIQDNSILNVFNEGDLWFQVFNSEEDAIMIHQKTFLLNTLIPSIKKQTEGETTEEKNPVLFITAKITEHGSGTIIVGGYTLDVLGSQTGPALVCSFACLKSKTLLDFPSELIISVKKDGSVSTDNLYNEMSANVSFQGHRQAEDWFTNWAVVVVGLNDGQTLEAALSAGQTFVACGKAGERQTAELEGEEDDGTVNIKSISELSSEYDAVVLYKVIFYNEDHSISAYRTLQYSSFQHLVEGSTETADHTPGNGDNTTEILLEKYIKSIGVTWYPFKTEV